MKLKLLGIINAIKQSKRNGFVASKIEVRESVSEVARVRRRAATCCGIVVACEQKASGTPLGKTTRETKRVWTGWSGIQADKSAANKC